MPAAIGKSTRLSFGKVVFSPACENRLIFAHCREMVEYPCSALVNVVEGQNQLILERFSKMPRAISGPYEDKDGAAAGLGRILSAGAESEDEFILRVISFIQDPGFFAFDRKHAREDRPVTAGSILSRKKYDGIIFSHYMEPYILATSLMRIQGLEAFPSLAIAHLDEGKEEHSPIMAALGSGTVMMKTFALEGIHPPMCSMELLDDVAMAAAAEAMRAENRAKLLAKSLLRNILNKNVDLPEDEIDSAAAAIADLLYQSHLLWPDNFFIREALTSIAHEVSEKLAIGALSVNSFSPAEQEAMAGIANDLGVGLMIRAHNYLEQRKRQGSLAN